MIIRFRPGKLNLKTDILSRRSDVYPYDADYSKKNPTNLQPIFSTDQIDASLRATYYLPIAAKATLIMDTDQLLKDILNAQKEDQFSIDKSILFNNVDKNLNNDEENWNRNEQGFVCFQNRIYVPDLQNLRLRVLQSKHDHILSGHLGQTKTYHLVHRDFYWPRL
jgi:hypothetical protein